MCSVSVVIVVFIHTMEDDQRLNTLVHEDDTLQHCKEPVQLVYHTFLGTSSEALVCDHLEVQSYLQP